MRPTPSLASSRVVLSSRFQEKHWSCLTRDGMLAMIYKLGVSAEKSWRRLRGFEWLAKVVEGVKFRDGIDVQTELLRGWLCNRRTHVRPQKDSGQPLNSAEWFEIVWEALSCG